MLTPDYPIYTERLVIRPFRDGDLDGFFDLYRRPDVMRYLYWEPFSRVEAEESLTRKLGQTALYEEGQRLALAVVLPDADRVIGDVTLKWQSSKHRQGELGYSFHPDHHGRGFATEACEAVVDLGFCDLGLHRIAARCDARNTASARVLERLGMRLEAHFVHNEIFKGDWGDELVYAMLDNEWTARHRDRPAPPPGEGGRTPRSPR